MTAVLIGIAATVVYCASYTVYCIRKRNVRASVCAGLMTALPVAGVVLVLFLH